MCVRIEEQCWVQYRVSIACLLYCDSGIRVAVLNFRDTTLYLLIEGCAVLLL